MHEELYHYDEGELKEALKAINLLEEMFPDYAGETGLLEALGNDICDELDKRKGQ